jgi:hypothetical protein
MNDIGEIASKMGISNNRGSYSRKKSDIFAPVTEDKSNDSSFPSETESITNINSIEEFMN